MEEKILQSSQIFDDRGRRPNIDEKIRSKDGEIAGLKDVIAEITQENLTSRAMDRRFNPFAMRDEEWLIVGFKMKYPNLGFREIAYVFPSTVSAALRRHGLVTTRKEKILLSKERYQP